MVGAECAGLVPGVKTLTSRSDSITACITMCALAVLVEASVAGQGAQAWALPLAGSIL